MRTTARRLALVPHWSYDRMSAYDASYLDVDREQPQHAVIQVTLSGQVSAEEISRHLSLWLPAFPLMQRMLRKPWLGGRPVWVDDPHFDLSRHVSRHPSSVATSAAASEVMAALATRRLPQDRPLWHVEVGGSNSQTYLWLRFHHAMMDGSLLATMLARVFPVNDVTPPPPTRPRPGPSRLVLLLMVLLRRLRRFLTRVDGDGVTSAPASASPSSPRSLGLVTLAGPLSDERRCTGFSVPLAELAQLRRRGARVNDIFLAAVTGGLRRFLEDPRDLVALIPRDVREPSAATTIGNRHWSMLVSLPVARETEPAAQLRDLQEQTAVTKTATHTAHGRDRPVDMVLTNLRLGGPHAVAGRLVTDYRVYAPLQGTRRLVIVAHSYDDRLSIDLSADAAAFPDLDRLRDLIQDALQELLAHG